MTGTVSGTTPYPWPYDGTLDPARTALVVVGPAASRARGRAPSSETGARVDAPARCTPRSGGRGRLRDDHATRR